jgi:hypothetical protein
MMGALVTASSGLAAACGGSTTGGSSAAAQLERNGSSLCTDACEALVACGKGGKSCVCSNSGDGTDDSCVCEAPSVERCAGDCADKIDGLLEDAPGCADEMLALIDCVTSSACADARCETAADRLERCERDTLRDDIKDVPVARGDGVRCSSGFGSGSAAGPTPVGSVVCEQGFGGCSDGSDYRVACTAIANGSAYCQCLIDGTFVGAFSSDGTCSHGADFLNEVCGWNLAP